jgi:hypothetical protein
MFVSNFSPSWGKMLWKRMKCYKQLFGEQKCEGHKFFEWFSKFKSGVTITKDAKFSECLSTSKTDEYVYSVKAFVLGNRRIMIHEVVKHVGNFIWVSSKHSER